MKVEVKETLKGKEKKVYQAVKKYLEGRNTLEKLGGVITWTDKNCHGKITGKNFSGNISVKEKGEECLVAITIELPLLLMPFKGKVEEELKKHISRLRV